MMEKQLQQLLQEVPDRKTGPLRTVDEAMAHMDRIGEAYRDAEKAIPPLLRYLRDGKYAEPETIRKTAVCILTMYCRSDLLDVFRKEKHPELVLEDRTLDGILSDMEDIKAFDGKLDLLVKMGYVRFKDPDTNTAYDPVRLGIKRVVASRGDEDGLIGKIALLNSGFETTDQLSMVRVFQNLSGQFDARILSNILVKNFRFMEGNRELFIRGFGLEDEKFLSIIHGGYETPDMFFAGQEEAPREQAPSAVEDETEDTGTEASGEKTAPEPADTPDETRAADTGTPEDAPEIPAEDARGGEVPETRERPAEEEPAAPAGEKTAAEEKTETGEKQDAEKKTGKKAKKVKPAPEKKTGAGTVNLTEGRAKKAFENTGAENEVIPDGFFITEDSFENTVTAVSDERPAVQYAYSLLDTEGGAAAALEFIGKAAEKDEELIFVEEQMMYAFGDAGAGGNAYSHDKLVEVFGDGTANADLFGAAVLVYAFEPGAIYEYDQKRMSELIGSKFSDREYANSFRYLFSMMCSFKSENRDGLVACLAGGDEIGSLLKEADELGGKLDDYRKTVENAYQANNPFLDIMSRTGYGEIYRYFDMFRNAENKGDAYCEIADFLERNRLVSVDRKTGAMSPDESGINAYKDAVWNEISRRPEAKKRSYGGYDINDFGKSYRVNKYYRSGVKLLIGCMELAERFARYDVKGYLRARKEVPAVTACLRELTGNGYRAVDYMADRYMEKLEE